MSPATRYRRVRVRLWMEPAFRKLKNAEQLVAFYLLSGPQTSSVGCYQLSAARAAEDLAMSVAQFRRCFAAVMRAFGWRHEAESGLLWLQEWIEENAPANPNICRAWRSAFDELPDSPLKAEAVAATFAFLKSRGEAFAKAFSHSVVERVAEPSGNGLPNSPVPDPVVSESVPTSEPLRRAERQRVNGAQTREIVDRLRTAVAEHSEMRR